MTVKEVVFKNNGSAVVKFDELELVCDQLVLSRYDISKEKDIDKKTLQILNEHSKKYVATQKALNTISRTDISKKALEKKLKEKGVDSKTAKDTADTFEQKGYINDLELAKRLASRYLTGKNFGLRRAKLELYNKGISSEHIETALSEFDNAEDELCFGLILKKYKNIDFKDKAQRNKAINGLLRAGHSFGSIKNAIERFGIEIEYIEENS